MMVAMSTRKTLQGCQGFTALHWAASRGHEACVAMLLARGADPNLQTHPPSGSSAATAADLASQAGHHGIAAFLSESSLVRGLTKLRRTKSGDHCIQQCSEASSGAAEGPIWGRGGGGGGGGEKGGGYCLGQSE